MTSILLFIVGLLLILVGKARVYTAYNKQERVSGYKVIVVGMVFIIAMLVREKMKGG